MHLSNSILQFSKRITLKIIFFKKLLLILSAAIIAQSYSSESAAGNITYEKEPLIINNLRFADAWHDSYTVHFYAHFKIDWEKLAPKELTDIDINKPPKDFLKKLNYYKNVYNLSHLIYKIPKTAIKQEGYYYFISSKGVKELEIYFLKGIAMYRLNKDGTEINLREYTGNFVGNPIDTRYTNEGGFVLFSKESLKIDQVDFEMDEKMIKKYRNQTDGGISPFSEEDLKTYYSVKKSFMFTINKKDKYIFIRWAPDKLGLLGSCTYRYSLLDVANEHREMIYNMYDCVD